MKGTKIVIARTFTLVFLVLSPGIVSSAKGQPGGGGVGGSTSAGLSPVPAPSGSTAVESVVVAYSATNELAKQISHRICTNDYRVTWGHILLGSPANLSAVQSYLAFETGLRQLQEQYRRLPPEPSAASEFQPKAEISSGASTAIQAVTAAVGAAKSQTTQTTSTFTPVDQVLLSDLEREMEHAGCEFITTVFPEEVEDASRRLQTDLERVLAERHQAQIRRKSDTPDEYGKDKDMQSLDAELSNLEESLGNTTASQSGSTVLVGKALLQTLGPNYFVLTLANAAAGGGTRANVYFLLNLLIPAPHPSYNGGAAGAYSVRTMDGRFVEADTLYFVFGHTKWRQPPLRNQSNRGFANFNWDNSQNRGSWQPIY